MCQRRLDRLAGEVVLATATWEVAKAAYLDARAAGASDAELREICRERWALMVRLDRLQRELRASRNGRARRLPLCSYV